ncbi:MAG TPA: phosphoribosylformylglycinamidine cyclo-ligase [Nitrososphaerales archaeon]|nr:phosphoribosylformylglycinamidine cyclo-ligase [Nitrososphaerales archaeon]
MSKKRREGQGDAYARAGVDVGKVRAIQGSLASVFSSTFATRRGKFGEPAIAIGHYAGLIDIGGGKLLAMHTDGVGTKVLIAQEMHKFETIGVDCVAMTVNDLICLGCEPVALLDYIALEKENEGLVTQLSKGLVSASKEAGAAIVGGETAIVGDLLKGVGGNGFDLVSMGVGVVDKGRVIDGSAIGEHDAVIGIESTGLHSNGYTLARRIAEGLPLDEPIDELGESLGDALLRPTRIYVEPTLEAVRRHEVHGIAHITGGAFTKLTRLVPSRRLQFDLGGLGARDAPPIFRFLQRRGRLSAAEAFKTFNMGVGLCLVAPRSEVEAILRTYRKRGFDGRTIGSMKRGEGVVLGATRLV